MRRSLFFILIIYVFIAFNANNKIYAESQSTLQVELDKRISEYEKLYPVSISSEDSQVLSERCNIIQKKISGAKDRVNLEIANRENVYGNIERKLSSIQSRLSSRSFDTSVIDLMLASYRIEVSNFKFGAEKYSTILTDAASMDCVGRPSSFKSTVLALRDARLKPVLAMSKIRDVYNNSMVGGFELLQKQIYESN